MNIKRINNSVDYRDDPTYCVESVEDYVIKKLILKDKNQSVEFLCSAERIEKIPLELQPLKIVAAFGRLLSILADKNILNSQELQEILNDYESFNFEKQ